MPTGPDLFSPIRQREEGSLAEKGGKQGPGQWLRGTLKEAQGGDPLPLAAAPAKPAPRPPPEKRLGLAGITSPRLYVAAPPA